MYTLTVAVRAFFPRKDAAPLPDTVREASPLMTVPMLLLAAVTLTFGILGGRIADLFTALLFG
jgi:NADH:ubiquinone oxidoreductase subunit 5 (subunit L)/multisubunit Na+/H+ antiporter MnhA subunit